MNLITEIVFIFVIYSFLGWILESAYKTILQKRIVNSGFLIGPFCPIYGYGALIMYYALTMLKDNILLLFFASFIILSIWEYIVGVLLEVIFKTKYWDYSNNFLNINGRICLKNSLFWGVLGTLFILYVHPFIYEVVLDIPVVYLIVFIIVSMAYIVTDTIITATNIIKVNIKIGTLEEIEKGLKKRITVMNHIMRHKERTRRKQFEERLEQIGERITIKMNSLEEGRDEIIKLIEKRTKRIRNAFPTMKSERLFKIVNKKQKKVIK